MSNKENNRAAIQALRIVRNMVNQLSGNVDISREKVNQIIDNEIDSYVEEIIKDSDKNTYTDEYNDSRCY